MKEVPDYPGYFVDVEGNVYTCWHRKTSHLGSYFYELDYDKIRLLEPSGKNGAACLQYDYYSIRRNNKAYQMRAHELVLLTFVGPKPIYLWCIHKNGVPIDNRPENLYYGTCSQCLSSAKHNKTVGGIHPDIQKEIYEKMKYAKVTYREAAITYNITERDAYHIGLGHIKYIKRK